MSAGSGQHRFRAPRSFVGLVKPGGALLIVLSGTYGHASPALLCVMFMVLASFGSRK